MAIQRGMQKEPGWFSEKNQAFACLLIFEIFLIYQLSKPFLINRNYDIWGSLNAFDLSAGFWFFAGAALLTWATPRLGKVKNNIISAGILIVLSMWLSISYTFLVRNDWSGLDVPYDSVGLAREVQTQGALSFIQTYNDRGNPTQTEFANPVQKAIEKLGLQSLARDKWIGSQPIHFGRPFMHPPLFFIILAGWMELFGSSEWSATWFMWLSTAVWVAMIYWFLYKLNTNHPAFFTGLFLSLPGIVIDTWFPNYDVIAGITAAAGFGLFILAFQSHKRFFFGLSGSLLGFSMMVRLTNVFIILAVIIGIILLFSKKLITMKSITFWGLGVLLIPVIVLLVGYNPFLTVITAKFRQDVFYASTQAHLGMQLASITFLGFSLLILVFSGFLKTPVFSKNWTFILMPLLASVFMAMTTSLSFDFHRNMLGVSACFILALAVSKNTPNTPWVQSVMVGVNLAYTLLVTVL